MSADRLPAPAPALSSREAAGGVTVGPGAAISGTFPDVAVSAVVVVVVVVPVVVVAGVVVVVVVVAAAAACFC